MVLICHGGGVGASSPPTLALVRASSSGLRNLLVAHGGDRDRPRGKQIAQLLGRPFEKLRCGRGVVEVIGQVAQGVRVIRSDRGVRRGR